MRACSSPGRPHSPRLCLELAWQLRWSLQIRLVYSDILSACPPFSGWQRRGGWRPFCIRMRCNLPAMLTGWRAEGEGDRGAEMTLFCSIIVLSWALGCLGHGWELKYRAVPWIMYSRCTRLASRRRFPRPRWPLGARLRSCFIFSSDRSASSRLQVPGSPPLTSPFRRESHNGSSRVSYGDTIVPFWHGTRPSEPKEAR